MQNLGLKKKLKVSSWLCHRSKCIFLSKRGHLGGLFHQQRIRWSFQNTIHITPRLLVGLVLVPYPKNIINIKKTNSNNIRSCCRLVSRQVQREVQHWPLDEQRYGSRHSFLQWHMVKCCFEIVGTVVHLGFHKLFFISYPQDDGEGRLGEGSRACPHTWPAM